MKIIQTALTVTFLVVLSTAAVAQITVTQVTDSPNQEDSLPQIEGDLVVWQSQVGIDWQIFVYNIATNEIVQVPGGNGYRDLSPQTDGESVVWQGFNNGAWDIFLWNGQETLVISEPDAEDFSPRIAGGFVVWTSEPIGEDLVGPAQVMLYDIAGQTVLLLSDEGVDAGNLREDYSPRINSERVAWLQTDDQDNTTRYEYSLSTGQIVENPEGPSVPGAYKDGYLSVLARHDGIDDEIFLYSENTAKEYQITDNEFRDSYSSISGNRIAWMANGEIFLAECKFLVPISPGDGSTLPRRPPHTFQWEGIGYHGFRLDFSADSSFPRWRTLTLPGWGNELSETSYTPASREWLIIKMIGRNSRPVFWRVRAINGEGDAVLSQTFSFKVEQRAPVGDHDDDDDDD